MPGKERGPVPNVTCPPSSCATSRERFCRCHNQRRAFHATRKERTRRADRSPMLLDAAAVADMLTSENSGFLLNRACALRSRFPNCVSIVSLEHLLRYCSRPPFALERLSVNRGADGRIARVRYVLPQHFGWHTGYRRLGLIEAARPRRHRRRNWHVHDGIIGRLFSRRPPHPAELFSVKNGQ